MEEQRQVCPNCGTRDEEWRDEKKRPVEPPPYEVQGHRCSGCVALEEYRNRPDVKENSAGLYLALRPYQPDDDDEMEGDET